MWVLLPGSNGATTSVISWGVNALPPHVMNFYKPPPPHMPATDSHKAEVHILGSVNKVLVSA